MAVIKVNALSARRNLNPIMRKRLAPGPPNLRAAALTRKRVTPNPVPRK